MPDLSQLAARIDAEIAGFQKSTEQFQSATMEEYHARETRFRSLFLPAAERIVAVIRPRLKLLVERFQGRVDVKPVITEHQREVTLNFHSPLARIDLTIRLGHDTEVRNLVIDQALEVLPILMKFDSGANVTMPLDKIDEDAIGKWFDERLVGFVQTVKAIHQHQYYLKDHTVVDPIAGVQMPKYAAAATLERAGKTYYCSVTP